MPLPKTFRQGKYKLPHRLTWDISPSLGGEILNSFQLAQKVSSNEFNNDYQSLVLLKIFIFIVFRIMTI